MKTLLTALICFSMLLGSAALTDPAKAAGGADSALSNPAKATKQAPATFDVRFKTTKGDVLIRVTRDWSPRGADRFYNMVQAGFYKDIAFFRVIAGFMAQFGIHGDPVVSRPWKDATIKDDPVKQSNKRGFVSFAMAGPNTRTTQLFINYSDKNARLDSTGFSPFGQVIEGMETIDNLYSGYGEGADQPRAQQEGNAYLKASFPNLDYIRSAELVRK